MNLLETVATVERIIAYACNAAGDHDARKADAIRERRIADARNALANHYALKAGALEECRLINHCDAVGENYALYIEKFRKFMSAKEKIIGGDVEKVFEEPATIRFENVSFTYPGNDKPTLKNINLEIGENEFIGIIGHTGSGKSTLIQLIPRIYDATEGEVLIGGENVKSYTFKNLREEISVVLQQNLLFSGSIKENIRWGKPDATDEELEAYRRAERIEREARERSELVYFQANSVLTEASAKVDTMEATPEGEYVPSLGTHVQKG